MIQRNKYFLAGCHLIIYMMLAIFAAMPLLQAFHSHESENVTTTQDDQRLAKAHTDCHFCHQFSHNQHDLKKTEKTNSKLSWLSFWCTEQYGKKRYRLFQFLKLRDKFIPHFYSKI